MPPALHPGFYPGPTAFPGDGDDTPGITAVPEPGNYPPRVRLEITKAAGSATGQVLRTGADGRAVPVRQGDPATLTAGAWVGYDYEIRYNQLARYEWVPTTGARLTSSDVRLDVANPWLIHPGIPALSCPVIVKLIDDEVIRGSGGLHDVLDSPYAVPVSNGGRKAPNFQVILKTLTKAERDALDQLFFDQAPLLLQMVYPAFTDESEYRWVWFGDISRSRRSQVYADSCRIWGLPASEVARPLGGIRAQRSWADLLLECPTWAAVLAKYKTWRGVLTGIAGT
jgi:hypothetical protein